MERVNSTAVWPTEMPDVFNFPDSFFNLQNDLNDCVLDYLNKMGYSESYIEFNESSKGKKDKCGDKAQVSLNLEDSIDELFDALVQTDIEACGSETEIKYEATRLRKQIFMFIINGEVEQCTTLIHERLPLFFYDFKEASFKLNYLHAVEKIRSFISNDNNEEQNEDSDRRFFDSFIRFVEENLSDTEYLQHSPHRFVKDMELLMGLLVNCKKVSTDLLPSDMSRILQLRKREETAIIINRYLMDYLHGNTTQRSMDQDSDEETGIETGNDQHSIDNAATRLSEMVRLFVWSYNKAKGN